MCFCSKKQFGMSSIVDEEKWEKMVKGRKRNLTRAYLDCIED
jgi:hypothetical protein